MKGLSKNTLIIGTVLSTVVVILASPLLGGVAFLTAGIIIAVASAYFRSRLAGITGDCFGATFQLVEIVTYAVFLA